MFYPAGVYRATSPHDVRARLHTASAFYEGIGEKLERNGQNGERRTPSEKEINMRPVHLLAQRIDSSEIFAIFPPCDPGVAVDRFFHALYSRTTNKLMPLLLGTACSEVTETLAKIVAYWNVIQVSFGSTAPALSDSTEFPLFLRTVAPDSSHNSARIALIKHYGWDSVTALSQTGDMYSLAVNNLVTELEQANITCTATITFAENDYKEQLRTLKVRQATTLRSFFNAWKLGMHGGDYAWILPGDTIDLTNLSEMTNDWWESGPEECSPLQLSQALDGLIIVKSYGSALKGEISSSGLTSRDFISELAKRGVTHSKFAAQTYDAVWAMALALANTETILNGMNKSMAQYTHENKDLIQYLLEQLKLLHFIGVSGPVFFDGADRVGITAFYQLQGPSIREIAIFTPEDGKLIMNCPGCVATRWPGGHPPAARRVFRLRVVTVAPAAFLAVTCLASIGVALAIAFLAFNLHFRKHKSIKLSSPRLNNMAAVGCCLVYGAVILLGLDHATLPDSDDYFPTVCTARVYLLSAGFSLAFGSMFTKTYRVHRIFTRSRSGVVKNKVWFQIYFITILRRNGTATGYSTDKPNLHTAVDRRSGGDTVGNLGSNATSPAHVKIPALNDSQYIGMSVYSVVITSGIVVVLANLMSDRATLAFVTITALILASTTATLALLFLPQLANILAGERADPVVQSLGLKIECNTRRFVTDDRRIGLQDNKRYRIWLPDPTILLKAVTNEKITFRPRISINFVHSIRCPIKETDIFLSNHVFSMRNNCARLMQLTRSRRELQYRVEVQNRVYRREMAQLELELARLEKQLAQEPVEPSHASSSTSIPQRNPSIGGGLPLLLLSVLPSVIPRASWPSADPSGMRRGTVAFSSQPDLEPDDPRRSLADIYKLHRRRETEGPNRLGVFQRLFSLFGSRPTSRKTSTASFTGVASALRVHMGYIAGLVPGAKAASTCQMDAQGSQQSHPRCGSGPIISITSEEDRRLSLGLRRKESSEPRVNFTLPPQANSNQSSSREKIRGSPRFPHRIVPANSLSAIASGLSAPKPHRWHSMEDARRSKTNLTPRGSSYSPLCDVWATHEVGIPLSELGKSVRGRKPPESLALTIKADSNISPDDARLGNDLKRLFRENDVSNDVSPVETELKVAKSTSSSSSTPTNLKLSSTMNDVVLRNGSRSGSTTLTVVLTDALQQEQECSRPTSPKILIARLDEDVLRDASSNDQEPTNV
ncbi:gamma-aminobutyric acid type B receptor subunit 2 isoform X1 [Vespula maculifrons]|uniref:Gamma-aminobutyric acid type B receptor subunit 2 isoform X1 n=1 Tax=Vespula maculifrons TaxID=7453 RepID=A0ABD2BII6_VESMC